MLRFSDLLPGDLSLDPLYDGYSAYGVYHFQGKIYKVFYYKEHLINEVRGYHSIQSSRFLKPYISDHRIVGFHLDTPSQKEAPPYTYALEIDYYNPQEHWISLGKMLDLSSKIKIKSFLQEQGIDPATFIHELHKAGIADQEVTFFIHQQSRAIRMVDVPYNQTYANFGSSSLDDLLLMCE